MIRVSLLLCFSVSCFIPTRCLAKSSYLDVGDFSVFIGSVGPLFAGQAGFNVQFSYQQSQMWSFDIEGGAYESGSVIPYIKESYSSVGTSFFITEVSSVKQYMPFDDPLFIRSAYSYHDALKIGNRDGIIIGRRISQGVEVSVGFRKTQSWYIVEVIPVTFYFPVTSQNSGELLSANSVDRIISLKIGISF